METIVRELEEAVEIPETSAESAEPKEYSFEEIAELNHRAKDTGITYELSDGELREKMGSTLSQSDMTVSLVSTFQPFLKTNPIAKMLIDYGFILQREPRKTLRFPDLAFVVQSRMPEEGVPQRGYWEFVPDLAIEIVSPEDKLYEVCEKAIEYIRLGVQEVWLAIPPFESFIIYRSNKNVRYLTRLDELESQEILPDFSVSIADLFQVHKQKETPKEK